MKKNLKRRRNRATCKLGSLIKAKRLSSVIAERIATRRAMISTAKILKILLTNSMMTKTMNRTKSSNSRIINKRRQVALSVKRPRLAKSAFIRCIVKI